MASRAAHASLRATWSLALGLSGCALEAAPPPRPPPSDADAGNPPPVIVHDHADGGIGGMRPVIAVLPDTQFYACAYPDIFEQQTRYIAEEHEALGIAIVLHTGDVVDDVSQAAQVRVATHALAALPDHVPSLVTLGNHDLDARRVSSLREALRPDELGLERALESGFMQQDSIDNAFAVVELAGEPWLFVGLEFAPRDATVTWADQVLQSHAELPAVVFTHAYLYSDGTRYDRARGGQRYHPDGYGVTPDEGINDGEDLWRKLIEPNPNVKLVLSGHVIPDGTARAVSERASGSVVHELLANYQTCDFCPCAEVEGGGGYLRLLELDPATRELRVTTHSPYLGDDLTDAENRFNLALAR